ncbi:aldolase/citrate lyase family protein [Massilia sp. MB5]|uniref:HpcH/HpaI aldolase/citrate lyase family protein n=1 Tax=Massilia sp. MB5 TaxID=2919578 RepID=UPI001F0F55FB|nr:aldolase/citrate lyase family protein [Massilia sp. MB5]UMR32893.1 aldolase/citrate lyase family protein [Massilia sp. MB5]
MDIAYLNTSILKFNPQAADPSFGSDVVILDLEDAVHARDKETARAMLAQLELGPLLARGLRFGLRINSLMSLAGLQDLAALDAFLRREPDSLLFVQLPKVESDFEIRLCRTVLREGGQALRVVPIIETPGGVEQLEAIAALSDAMMFGRVDMGASLYRSNAAYLAYARGRFCAACAQRGIAAIDTANFGSGADIMNLAAFEQDCLDGRAEGFTARAVVHPNQVAVVKRIFALPEDELQACLGTISAYAEAHTGFSVVDGRVIAPPFVARARKMLNLYQYSQGDAACTLN